MRGFWLGMGLAAAMIATPALAEGEHVLEDEYGNPVVTSAAPKPAPRRATKSKSGAKAARKAAPEPLPAEVEKALTPVVPAVKPAPIVVVLPPAPPPPPPEEIALACQTQVSRGSRVVSAGGFILRFTPSAVFEDQADIRFNQIDPAHESLVRQSRCVDLVCLAQVSPGAYYLVSQPDKKRPLRLTLDRTTGAFTGEAGKGSGRVVEQGYCQALNKTTPLF